jgi:hypothetical protein
MIKKLIIFLFVSVFIFSCSTSPTPLENTDFQKETGMSLTFVKRGLYSIPKSYKDEGYADFYNKLVNNEIIFSVDEAQNEWALFKNENGIIYITLNGLFKKYNQGSNNALLTSTVYIAGLIGIDMAPQIMETRFYDVIADYKKYGVDVSLIVKDDLFKDKRFKIMNNGIKY